MEIKFMKSFIIVTIVLFFCTLPVFAQRIAVTSEVANIRTGPGTKYQILWKAEKYFPIKVKKKTGNWILFNDFEGDQGWIHKSMTGKITAVITKSKQCNIRSGPGNKYKVIIQIGKGIPFKVLGKKGPWLHLIHADKEEGWMHKSLVW